MANCTISDRWSYWTAPGVLTGLPNVQVYAVPDSNTRRYLDTGVYRNLGINPNIASAAFKYGRVATTGAQGDYSFSLPQESSSKPSEPAPAWTIVLPDGKMLTGVVPNVAGPLTLDDLETSHGWTWASSVYVAPVTPGTLAQGTATFVASSTANILFGAPFASANYRIILTPSLDSVTNEPPAVAWTEKTTTGFTIKATGTFSGSVDWRAEL